MRVRRGDRVCLTNGTCIGPLLPHTIFAIQHADTAAVRALQDKCMEDPGTGADQKHVTSKTLKSNILSSRLRGLVGALNHSRNVIGVVGLGYSSEAILTEAISEELKTVMISHSASSPDRTSFPWFARTVPTDTWQGEALAALLESMQITNATVVFCPDSYCRGLAESLQDSAVKHGIGISAISEADFALGSFIGQDCTRWNEVIVFATWASFAFELFQRATVTPEYNWSKAIWMGFAAISEDGHKIPGQLSHPGCAVRVRASETYARPGLRDRLPVSKGACAYGGGRGVGGWIEMRGFG